MITAANITVAAPYELLIDRLDDRFRSGCIAPIRHHHRIDMAGGRAATLLLMPAWQPQRYMGVKLATVFPDNVLRSLPSVFATYVLMDGGTGRPLAVLDGTELTRRRTAAASALAARYLAPAGARVLLMVGTGALVPYLAEAHSAVRPIEEVRIWGRNPAKAETLSRVMARRNVDVHAVTELAAAAANADIISCATLATEPLLRGDWLKAGAHVDLVGGFTPTMREADDEVVRRGRLFVDTREGAMHEAGDIVVPLETGVIQEGDIVAELAELARKQKPGRQDETEITVFKSVGTALEDLATAELVFERALNDFDAPPK